MASATLVAAISCAFSPIGYGHVSAQTPDDAELQIAEAVMAAPAGMRDNATVHGWTATGRSVTLRDGTNDLVCISDNPVQNGWSVACYPTSIEPYMKRGRELSAQGVTDSQERLRIRWAEADAGTLAMPNGPATVFILVGDGFDSTKGEVTNAFLRWAIYTPWATPEATGLSPQPLSEGAPWLMFPGTAGAHIMVTPARPQEVGR